MTSKDGSQTRQLSPQSPESVREVGEAFSGAKRKQGWDWTRRTNDDETKEEGATENWFTPTPGNKVETVLDEGIVRAARLYQNKDQPELEEPEERSRTPSRCLIEPDSEDEHQSSEANPLVEAEVPPRSPGMGEGSGTTTSIKSKPWSSLVNL